MSIIVTINEKHAAEFNVGAWNRFCEWVDTLPLPDFELAVRLSEHGWAEPVAQLRSQLVAAKQRSLPENRNAKAIADDMIRLLIDPQFDDESDGVVIASLDGDG